LNDALMPASFGNIAAGEQQYFLANAPNQGHQQRRSEVIHSLIHSFIH
jgi:hypothetical protein